MRLLSPPSLETARARFEEIDALLNGETPAEEPRAEDPAETPGGEPEGDEIDDEALDDLEGDELDDEEPEGQQGQQGRYQGEWDGRTPLDGSYSVLFGPYPTVEEAQAELGLFPGALEALTRNGPWRYRALDGGTCKGVRVFGTGAGNPGYTDVCRNFRFFSFQRPDDVVWLQTTKS